MRRFDDTPVIVIGMRQDLTFQRGGEGKEFGSLGPEDGEVR